MSDGLSYHGGGRIHKPAFWKVASHDREEGGKGLTDIYSTFKCVQQQPSAACFRQVAAGRWMSLPTPSKEQRRNIFHRRY